MNQDITLKRRVITFSLAIVRSWTIDPPYLIRIVILGFAIAPPCELLGQDERELRWITGDPHLHAHGCGGGVSDEALVQMLDVNDLNVGSVLVWGQGYRQDRGSFTGDDHPLSLPDHILHYDLEVSYFAAGHAGHLNILGLSEIEFSQNPYSEPTSGLPIVDWALEQNDRVVIGMNHAWAWPGQDGKFPFPSHDGTIFPPDDHDGFGPCCQLLEFPVHVANGTASFLEDEAGDFFNRSRAALSPGATHLWRVLQNSGFRLGVTGASDFLCMTNDLQSSSVMRTYLLIDGELSYDAYLDALRDGRTVAAYGPDDWMDFTIDDARLGDEVRASSSQQLSLTVATNFHRPDEVRIMVNGRPSESFEVESGPQTITSSLQVDESSWITVQSSRAQTSPIYALVDDKPIRASAEDACYLTQYMDHLLGLVGDMKLSGVEEVEVREDYQRARDTFYQRFLEAGGETCGPFDRFDFDRDGRFSVTDLDLLLDQIRLGNNHSLYDVTGDGKVDPNDVQFYVGDDGKLGTHMGDANLDGRVDFTDFLTLSNNFGGAGSGWRNGDFDGSGQVDFEDFLILSDNFGAQNAASLSVPEPAGTCLAILGILTVAGYRKRRRSSNSRSSDRSYRRV